MRTLSFLLLAAALMAQETTLRTSVRLVTAPTTVMDSTGLYVNGLTEEDFVLLDNGRPREIRADVTYVPISLVIAVQSSEISAAALNKVHKIGSMIEPLVIGERGEAAVLSFDDRVTVAQEFTSDSARVASALAGIRPSGGRSKMIDAVDDAVRMLSARPSHQRRIILLIGETKDRAGERKLEDVITRAQRENVAIYSLTYSAYLTPFTAKGGTLPMPGGFDLLGVFREIGRMGKTSTVEAFARYTGGERFNFVKQRGLEEAITRLGELLHSQYLLSFTVGEIPTGEYHTIQVQVKSRPEALIRTRPGYWSQ